MITQISTVGRTVVRHHPTDDEAAILAQIIDEDGEEAVILAREDLHDGSGHSIGERLLITDEAWQTVRDRLAETKA